MDITPQKRWTVTDFTEHDQGVKLSRLAAAQGK
jgi:hypothetical protein